MPKITPKDFFLQIGVIITLYISSISLIALLFQVINILHPDQLYSYVDPYSSGIRWAIASLIIIFPLCLALSWVLDRDYRSFPEKRGFGLKRWLTFLTLFIAGATIATDLIILINSFLAGEYTTRFILKVVVVLFVAGYIFGYYLWDLRRSVESTSNKSKYFAFVAVLVVLASVVGGFLVMGSPKTQRNIRNDENKVSDLQNIQYQLISYWQQKNKLPDQLNEINDNLSNFVVPIDKQSGQSYEYRKISNLQFELCANFNLESSATTFTDYPMMYPAPRGFENENWKHGIGRTCFARTIDPELYTPVQGQVKRL